MGDELLGYHNNNCLLVVRCLSVSASTLTLTVIPSQRVSQ